MKMLIFALVISLSAGLALSGVAADDAAKKQKETLRHVVAFKFKDTASKDQIKQVEDAFRALPGKIPQIWKFEYGTNVSPEKHDKGFTHGFIVTFKTAQDRDDYLVHPAHKEFGKLVGPVLADVFVIDFWAKD
jgi:hypothetical protein